MMLECLFELECLVGFGEQEIIRDKNRIDHRELRL